MSPSELENIVQKSHLAFLAWRKESFSGRATKMQNAAELLLKEKHRFAQLITQEMGKMPEASQSEVEKCALACRYFAEHAETLLADHSIKTEMQKSFIHYNPLGVVLAIMPWNFPFWQVFRFAAPALMAGNAGLLKHAPITTGSALAIESIFQEAGFPENLFRTIIVEEKAVAKLIADPKIAAVTLTGSPRAGSAVGEEAGKNLKKVVLELGGSDPYLILEDADLENAAELIVKSKMQVSGQSCIAPKRILAMPGIRAEFEKLISQKMQEYTMGSALSQRTFSQKISSQNTVQKAPSFGPIARADLRDHLHQQIQDSIKKGAKLVMGGVMPEGTGFYYPATILTNVKKGMPAYEEELFGPVFSFIDVNTIEEAVAVANDTVYGLGAAVFTQNIALGEKLAREALQAGSCFVNDFVKSDPRLPFGGIKHSGYGRELAAEGIRSFTNVKTVVIK